MSNLSRWLHIKAPSFLQLSSSPSLSQTCKSKADHHHTDIENCSHGAGTICNFGDVEHTEANYRSARQLIGQLLTQPWGSALVRNAAAQDKDNVAQLASNGR